MINMLNDPQGRLRFLQVVPPDFVEPPEPGQIPARQAARSVGIILFVSTVIFRSIAIAILGVFLHIDVG